MMEEKNNIQPNDEMIRQMMQSSKIQAPENLKYRIMQQIETEKALIPQRMAAKKEVKTIGYMLKDFKAIFGAAYFLLFGLAIFAILFKGKDALMSSQFIFIAGLVVVSSFSFWAFTRLDARLREKRRAKRR